MDFDPGEHDRRLVLERPVTTQAPDGQAVPAWQTVATVWAAYVPLRGRELFAAAAVHRENTARFRIRARPDVDQTWRVVFEGRPYDITEVIPLGRDRLEILAVSGVRDGG